MSLDSALPTDVPAEPERRNAEVIAAIVSHHAQLAGQLEALTAAVLTAVRGDEYTLARDALVTWYRTELMPHAEAEERALYGPASDIDNTRLLVAGMVAEHRSLKALIDELAVAVDPITVAAAAATTHAVFVIHLSKENDLLLPALDAAGTDLAVALDGMHEILGHGGAGQQDEHGCGCGGCGCGDESAEAADTGTIQLISAAEARSAELDVRTLAHGARHEIIFAKLDQLAAGEALVIVNDHDPKPLRYQTAAMWPDRFVWDYLESGPRIWRVAINRAG
ncbi:MAG: DUF2249 domain-containing protein [Mycobacteriaceae bacterium]